VTAIYAACSLVKREKKYSCSLLAEKESARFSEILIVGYRHDKWLHERYNWWLCVQVCL